MDQGTGYEYEQLPQEPARTSNPLGVVGFVLAFCLPPIGFLLSLIAVCMRPRGFAIAGLIVSLLTSSIAGVLVYGGYYYVWPALKATTEVVGDSTTIIQAIKTYQRNNGDALPPNLSALGLTGDTLLDPWGTPYLYEVGADGKSWTLKVAGPDGEFDDKETATITSGMEPEDIGNTVGNALGEAIVRHSMKRE